MTTYIKWFNELGMQDVALVGGKNASLGEMISQLSKAGVIVPGGFATTTHAYREFLDSNGLAERIDRLLAPLDFTDVTALAVAGQTIRNWLLATDFSPAFLQALSEAYQKLIAECGNETSFAVRSSATAEDLADASFAGQQETLLNVRGFDHLIDAVKQVFASLYNDRAISYRVHHGFRHDQVLLSAGIQKAPAGSCSPWIPNRASATSYSSPRRMDWGRRSYRVRSIRMNSLSTNRISAEICPPFSRAGLDRKRSKWYMTQKPKPRSNLLPARR